jgi:hypothetical protein
MSVLGISAKPFQAGTGGNIVGNQAGVTINFPPSNIFAHTSLQIVQVQPANESDNVMVSALVSKIFFPSPTKPKDVSWNAAFENPCTGVSFFLEVGDGGSGSALCIVEFMD